MTNTNQNNRVEQMVQDVAKNMHRDLTSKGSEVTPEECVALAVVGLVNLVESSRECGLGRDFTEAQVDALRADAKRHVWKAEQVRRRVNRG